MRRTDAQQVRSRLYDLRRRCRPGRHQRARLYTPASSQMQIEGERLCPLGGTTLARFKSLSPNFDDVRTIERHMSRTVEGVSFQSSERRLENDHVGAVPSRQTDVPSVDDLVAKGGSPHALRRMQ